MRNTKTVGDTKVRVTQLGLGGTGLGGMYKAVEESAALDTVTAAYDAGIRFFDTAPIYGYGLSERRLGQGVAKLPRNEISISSKVGYALIPLAQGEQSWDLWGGASAYKSAFDFTADAVKRSVEESLKRLGVDRLDMVAIHDPDECAGVHALGATNHFRTAMDQAYPALEALKSQGVIGAVGVGMNQWEMLCDFAKEGDFDYFLVAGRYTLLEQEALDTLLPLCVEKNISVVIGGPYNSGILATGAVEGAYYNYHPATPEILERVRRIEAVCARYNVALPAAALRFPLGHPSVVSVIPGARSVPELRNNVELANAIIPDAFWDDLKAEGLISAHAPVPATMQAA